MHRVIVVRNRGIGFVIGLMAFVLLVGRVSAQTNGVLREVWLGIGGTAVSDLTNNPAFPGTPSSREILTNGFEAPIGQADNYGQRLRAVLTPPTSGDYYFLIASDDASQLFISTDDTPANKRLIASVSSWTPSRSYHVESGQKSAAITLTGGSRYYMEALMKEGSGGDNLAVTWQMPGEGDPADNSPPVPNENLVPYGLAAPVFAVNPTNTTAAEGGSAMFFVQLADAEGASCQWMRSGTNIPGATAPTLIYSPVAMADNGSGFYCRAENVTGASNSAMATLTVIADTNRPVLLAANSMGYTQVVARFSERITQATATNTANYALAGTNGSVSINGAALDSSQSNIVLAVAQMTDSATYVLTVNNLRDQSAAGNLIAPNSRTNFIATAYSVTDIGASSPSGSLVKSGNGWDVAGGGADIGGTNDQFQFSQVSYTGDFDVQVRLGSLSLDDAWVEAGMVAREDLTPGSRAVAVLATPSLSGTYFQYRSTTNGPTTRTGSFPANYPDHWLRLKRAGDVFTAYAGLDGQNWAQLGTTTLTMPATIYFGFGVSSHNTSQLATAAFRDFGSVTNAGGAIPVLPFEPLGPCSRRTPLVISEIMYDTPDSWGGTNSMEFVEIWNSGLVAENLTGHRLTGDISFQFPDGTTIEPGQFLVVAKNPAAAQGYYGVTCLGPYTNKLANGGGTLRLRSELGSILLEIQYEDKAPWPAAANGTGHSLVLSRPSYGENDPRAWSASDVVGGSPGRFEHYGAEPARGVVFNEILAHTDPPLMDTLELFNTRTQAVNLSGAWLSDKAGTNKFRIPNGTVIPARGCLAYNSTQLGFALAAEGQLVILVNSNQTRVLDAINFPAQANAVSSGRYPDGAPNWQELSTRTFGATNTAPLIRPLVINEIMYHPISGSKDDEYIEIHNRAATNINIGGWKIKGGIGFTFPSNTVINAGAYFVVAENLTNLLARYPQLNATNTYGNFSGSLSHSSDRVTLTMPEDLISTNTQGVVVTNYCDIVLDEVTYLDGGRWGQWSDGGGSSLELIDPAADNRLAQNWADSDETLKSQWIVVDHTELLDHVFPLGGNGAILNEVQIMLLGEGEVLIDDVEVHSETPSTGPNLVANGTFSSGLTGWLIQGNHVRSSLEPAGSNNPSDSLRLRATGAGDNGANRVETDLTTTLSANTTASLKANVRWLRGHPELLFRLHGGGMEKVVALPTPLNCGTPGQPNSRRVANAGPAIFDISHSPVLPADGQPITVTARVNDPDGISAVRMQYRLDPSATVNTVVMRDDGQLGDAVANDGLYTARIGGFSAGAAVAFCVQAVDAHTPTTATNYFPADAPSRECVVRVGESVISGSLGTYRLWLTAANKDAFGNREALSNEPEDGTFVYNDCRVIYNASIRFRGSPFTRVWTDLTGYGSGYAYVWGLPADDRFLGVTELNTDSGEHGGRDSTALRELTSFSMAREMGLPNTYERFTHIVINGVSESSRGFPIMLDVQQANADFIASWFPNDADGDIYKIDDWFEYDDTPSMQANKSGSLQNFTTTGGVKKQARYRWSWEKKSNGGYNDDYSSLFDAVDACNAPDADYLNHLQQTFELDEWVTELAFRHVICDWDGYGYNRGKNQFTYRPSGGKFWMLPWDLDFSLGCTGGHGPQQDLFTLALGGDTASDNMPEVSRMYNHPHTRRIYLQTLQRLANGPLQDSHYMPLLEARHRALLANEVIPVSPFVGSGAQNISVPDWIQQRRAYILNQLPSVAFGLTTNSLTVSSNLAIISGTAPLDVKTIEVNGVVWPVTWTGVTTWTARVSVPPGTNAFDIVGRDFSGSIPSGASNQVSVVRTPGTPPSPAGLIVINEILFSPTLPDAEFVELFNTSSNDWFDVAGWRLNGLGYDFPEGSFIGPRSYLVLAKDRVAFSSAYGLNTPVYDVYGGNLTAEGETLSLIIPAELTGTNDFVVDRVRYEAVMPWPSQTNGVSLQLLAAAQDNSRVANWDISAGGNVPAVPATNMILLAYTNIWKYMQVSNLDGMNWTATNFNDSSWPSGPGLLAYENNSAINSLIKTALADPRTSTASVRPGHGYYFRDTFHLANNPASYTFNASGYIDDGAVFYVNGSEIPTRIRMNSGTVTNRTLASGTPPGSGGDATSPTTFTIPASCFRAGTNFIAVEVHQVTTNSTDIVFGLKLEATNSGTPAIIVAAATPGAANSIATALPPFPPVWLNELQADNVTGPLDNAGQHDPWAELYNNSATNFSLAGYYLSDTYTNLTKWAFPSNASIPAGSFTLVWCDNQTNQAAPNAIHTGFRLPSGSGTLALSRIVSNAVQIVDYLNYTNLPANWSYGDVPDGQPFYRNTIFFATPGGTNNGGSAPITIFINEWMADNTHTLLDPADNDYEDWFELYNPGTNAVNLGGYYLTDNLTNKFQFKIPNNGRYIVPPGGYQLVWADGETGQNNTNRADLHAGFSLAKGGEAIGLFAADGTLIDAVTFAAQTADVSQGRFPDGDASIDSMPVPTPRAANRVANTAPVLAPISNRIVTLGHAVSFTASATDAESSWQTLTFSLSGAPSGAAIHPVSGLFSWTPLDAPGTNTLRVIVSDNGTPSLSATQSFSITVVANVAPVLPLQTNVTIYEQTSLTVTNTATDSDLPSVTLTYSLLVAPIGAVIDTNGVITWTPSEAQGPSTNTFTTRVVDNGSPALAATNTFIVRVNEVNWQPELPELMDQTINELTLLTVTNTAADADLPANTLTYSLLVAPAGAVINTNGVITWTPSEAQGPGIQTFTTRVVDNGSPALASTNTFTVTVNEVNVRPVLAPLTNVTVLAGRTLNITNTATDADLPAQILTFQLSIAPAGMTLDPASGRISWRPSMAQAGTTNTVGVRVADNGTPVLADSKSFSVIVLKPAPPRLTTPSYSNGSFSFSVTGDQGPDYVIEFSPAVSTTGWVPLTTNLSPAVPFQCSLPALTNGINNSFRVRLAP